MAAWRDPDRELMDWADAGWPETDIRARELSGRRWYAPIFRTQGQLWAEKAAGRRVRRWLRARTRPWWKIWDRGN